MPLITQPQTQGYDDKPSRTAEMSRCSRRPGIAELHSALSYSDHLGLARILGLHPHLDETARLRPLHRAILSPALQIGSETTYWGARSSATSPASPTPDPPPPRALQIGSATTFRRVNLSTLRTIFDKLFGLDLLTRKSGPRRPSQLPYPTHANPNRTLCARPSNRRRLRRDWGWGECD